MNADKIIRQTIVLDQADIEQAVRLFLADKGVQLVGEMDPIKVSHAASRFELVLPTRMYIVAEAEA